MSSEIYHAGSPVRTRKMPSRFPALARVHRLQPAVVLEEAVPSQEGYVVASRGKDYKTPDGWFRDTSPVLRREAKTLTRTLLVDRMAGGVGGRSPARTAPTLVNKIAVWQAPYGLQIPGLRP
jgi:hypothetical protein